MYNSEKLYLQLAKTPSCRWCKPQACSAISSIHDFNTNACYNCFNESKVDLYFYSNNLTACIANVDYGSVYGAYNTSSEKTIFLNVLNISCSSKLYGACKGGSKVISDISINVQNVYDDSFVCGTCYWESSHVSIRFDNIYASKIVGIYDMSRSHNIQIVGRHLSYAEVYGVDDHSKSDSLLMTISNFVYGIIYAAKDNSHSKLAQLQLTNITGVQVITHDDTSSTKANINIQDCYNVSVTGGLQNDVIRVKGSNFIITSYLDTCNCHFAGNDFIIVKVSPNGWNFIYYEDNSTHQNILSRTVNPKSLHSWQMTGSVRAETNAGYYHIKKGESECSQFVISQAESVVRIINFDPKCDKIAHPPVESSSNKTEEHFYDLQFNTNNFKAPESTGPVQLETGGSSCFVKCAGALVVFQNLTCAAVLMYALDSDD